MKEQDVRQRIESFLKWTAREPTRHLFSQLATAAGVVLLFGGCTTVMYAGPRRSPDHVAILEPGSGGGNESTNIATLDGKNVQGSRWSKYEILPGRHIIGVRAHTFETHVLYTSFITSGRVNACFFAKPGHSYLARCSFDKDIEGCEIVDADTDVDAGIVCTQP
jgi:hypothetical protein